MKRVILLVAGLLVGTGGVLGQLMELPIEEVWRYEFNQEIPSFGSSWMENGFCHVLVKHGNRAIIISNGEVIWEVESPSGNILKVERVIFHEGPAIVMIYKSRGDFIVLKLEGDNYGTSTSYLFASESGNVDEAHWYDIIDMGVFNNKSD